MWQYTYHLKALVDVSCIVSGILDVEMTTWTENDLQMSFKPQGHQKSFSSLVTFAVSHTIYQKFDMKQSNDLEISSRSLTVISPESCSAISY